MRTLMLVVLITWGCASSPTPVEDDLAPVEETPAEEETVEEEVAEASAERTCNRPEMFGPVMVTEAEYQARYGGGETRYSAVPTSMERPVEACGVPRSQAWLAAATCDDGSRPFGHPGEVAGARVGSMGQGGLCGSILDLYEVPCPEATYEVYVDIYVCAEGMSLF